MMEHEVLWCPRCPLRFTTRQELEDHLVREHGAVVGEVGADRVVAAAPVSGAITVPVDPARPPTEAPAVAAALAARSRMAVELVATMLPGLPRASTDAYLRERQRESSAAGAPAVTICNLGTGGIAESIVARVVATGADLVCMTSRSRGAIGELVLGSVSERVMRTSSVPVLLVGPAVVAATEPYDRLLVALDGSEPAGAALAAASSLAQRLGASLGVVHVVDPRSPVDLDEMDRAVAGGVVPATFDAVEGRDPATAILEVAGRIGARIVATGTKGRSGLRRVTMGSVALAVVRRAPCPVLTVPPTAISSELVTGTKAAGSRP